MLLNHVLSKMLSNVIKYLPQIGFRLLLPEVTPFNAEN